VTTGPKYQRTWPCRCLVLPKLIPVSLSVLSILFHGTTVPIFVPASIVGFSGTSESFKMKALYSCEMVGSVNSAAQCTISENQNPMGSFFYKI